MLQDNVEQKRRSQMTQDMRDYEKKRLERVEQRRKERNIYGGKLLLAMIGGAALIELVSFFMFGD